MSVTDVYWNYKKMIKEDKKQHISLGAYPSWKDRLLGDQRYYLYKYTLLLRREELYMSLPKGFTFFWIALARRKNRLGRRLGISIPPFVFDSGLVIWHYGGIAVNGQAKVGKNVQLHGNNCIGNKGKNTLSPCIGDNVDIGFGASIIGNVTIGNNICIGANSVVTKSFNVSGMKIAGVPAHEIETSKSKK